MPEPAAGPTSASERDAIAWLVARASAAPPGAVWAGDDTAVLAGAPELLLATDVVVEGVHFDRSLSSLSDIGWKALATNLSDVAAMGGLALAAVVGLVGAGPGELEAIYEGLEAVGARHGCPVVGGDLSDGDCLVVSVAILGTTSGLGPVLRSGARPGDRVFLTAATGRAAAGLRQLRADPRASGECVEAHRRPLPRLSAGRAAAAVGATAMIDVSDGLSLDLDRLCLASGVGVVLDRLVVPAGATAEEALSGGDDYELCFCAPDAATVAAAFSERGLDAPLEIGEIVAEPTTRILEGRTFRATGYLHGLDGARRTASS